MYYDNSSCPRHRSDPILFTVIRKTLVLSVLISAAASAASPAIGIVTASGYFTVDRSQVWGNATIFEGSVVETSNASSEIEWNNGARLQLAKNSRARILAGSVVLEKGIGQVSAESFDVNASNLRIHTNGRLHVAVGENLQIASLLGSARVSSAAGMLLSVIPAGRGTSFEPQAANGTVTRTGCVLFKDNHYIMQDENTQEVVELSGQNLGAQVGNRAQVTGAASSAKPSVTIASLVVNVASVTPKSSGGCLSVASSLNAQTDVTSASANPATHAAETPKASGGGMSTGAKIAIIAVIAGGGAGAAIALSSKKSSTSP
jgi:hypothetical protein